jgi:16S rRNA (guanine(966)-N(2))-methyltransferase RsmD
MTGRTIARGNLRKNNPPLKSPPRSPGLPNRVRIIGGQYRRTAIPVADAPGLRPSPDRVRETVFNWIAHLRPDLHALRGLDLFAGSGALGFELASRGAQAVTLVERDTALHGRLVALRDRLGARQVEVIRGDAFTVGTRLPPASFDLVFLDPPFDAGWMPRSLALAAALLAPGGLIYAEAPAALDDMDLKNANLVQIRHGQAGRVHFHLLCVQQC